MITLYIPMNVYVQMNRYVDGTHVIDVYDSKEVAEHFCAAFVGDDYCRLDGGWLGVDGDFSYVTEQSIDPIDMPRVRLVSYSQFDGWINELVTGKTWEQVFAYREQQEMAHGHRLCIRPAEDYDNTY